MPPDPTADAPVTAGSAVAGPREPAPAGRAWPLIGAMERAAGLARYRTLVYIAIFFSGGVALSFQIVWQKYLSFLVGSEARSISLVVAVFLFGLATGYHFWGMLTQWRLTRGQIMKTVGYVELGIATWAILFAYIFDAVRRLSYAAPDLLAIDLVVTGLLLFLPTFLMGASIPLLTAAVPDRMGEVNYCHSRIYGINTLGAFLGAFVGGFYLVPTFGLPLSLLIGAAVNIGVAVVFILNRLEGLSHQAEEIPSIPNRFGTLGISLFVFTTGAVVIAFEVLFMRILGLTIGSGHYIFPIVVGVVILGLAIGALSLRRNSVTAVRVFRELLVLIGLLVILYFTVPYWPYWLSTVRVSLATIPSNYPIFLAIVVLFVALLLLPVVIPMGRLLPIGYALLDKNRSDYGRVCGRLYFVNTVGTVLGAVGIGYALFHVFDLETIFKINMAMLLVLTGFLALRHGSRNGAVAGLMLAGLVFALPGWDRNNHILGLFRVPAPEPYHFTGVFRVPRIVEPESVLFFRDDPSATVAVYRAWAPIRGRQRAAGAAAEEILSKTIVVNGKSDGNTVGDYSNMILTGVLPYLHAPKAGDLTAAVVGLGTGMTSGVLAAAPDVASVVTLEISRGVIDALPHFDEANFELSRQAKSRIEQTDAFRYFTRTRRQYDLVVSEPTNPWVVGVENLFTPEFYDLVKDVLAEDGIFFQWIQVYEMDNEIFAAVVDNVVDAFEHVSMFLVGANDVGILASRRPLGVEHMERRLGQRVIRQALAPMGIDDRRMISLLELYETEQLRVLAMNNSRGRHTLEVPWLGHAAGRTRFLHHPPHAPQTVRLGSHVLLEVGRNLRVSERRTRDAVAWVWENAEDIIECEPTREQHSVTFVCQAAREMLEPLTLLDQPLEPGRIQEQLTAYKYLREMGWIGQDLDRLARVRDLLIERPGEFSPEGQRVVMVAVVSEFAMEWEWAMADATARQFLEAGLIDSDQHEAMLRGTRNVRQQTSAMVEEVRRWTDE